MSGETREKEKPCDDDYSPPTNSLNCNQPDASTISTITGGLPRTPDHLKSQVPLIEMGLPPTPTSRVMKMIDEALIEDGYDTDCQLGPFIESGVEAEERVCMDEEPLGSENPNICETNIVENSIDATAVTAESVLTDELIDKMKVVELRLELEKRGISKNGLKADLVGRLKEAVAKNVPLLEDRPEVEVANSAGIGFEPGAYWQLMEQEGEELDESFMEVDGVVFRAPTTTEEEHLSDFAHKPKKRNYSMTFDRLPFIANRLLPVRNKSGRFRRKQNSEYIYKESPTVETIPNLNYIFSAGIGFDSHPADWFDLFFPRRRTKNTNPKAVTMDEYTAWTNTKAMMMNAGVGGGKYARFVNFSKDEMMSHLSLYLLHGISPSPQIDMKFKPASEDPINGSDLCFSVFGKNGSMRHREFKSFFTSTDSIKPTPPTASHPN